MAINIDFGSLDLDVANDIAVNKISIKEKRDLVAHAISKSDGSISETSRRQYLDLALDGDIIGSGYDDLRSNLDTLRAGLNNGKQKFNLDDDRYLMAQLKDFSYEYKKLELFAKWKASFLAHYPFWLSENPTISDTTPESGVGYTVTNNGNANARCKVEITAPTGGLDDDISFQNSTTGEGFVYRGELLVSTDLVVDNKYTNDESFIITNDGSSDFVNLEGDFITLAAGANTIIFTGGSDDVDVKITFRDTYY